MSRSERRVALPEALSSVVAEAPAPVLSLEAPLAHSHPPDGAGEQSARPGETQGGIGPPHLGISREAKSAARRHLQCAEAIAGERLLPGAH
jgi:hypothetical protein